MVRAPRIILKINLLKKLSLIIIGIFWEDKNANESCQLVANEDFSKKFIEQIILSYF